jgi:poly-gamma-glutamate capsule biosynthesis protein CapA/YwtB (metallophosphatase superfamily)
VRKVLAQIFLIFGMLLLVMVLLPPAGDSLRLALTGDIMLGRGVAQAHSNSSWQQALSILEPKFSTADFSFANLESPITEALLVKETYDLRAPPQSVLALSSSGINLVSLSNNHIADSGQQGIDDTHNALTSDGITPLGPTEEPLILHTKGIDLAWFALDDINGTLDLAGIRRSVALVRNRVDYIILSIHWGNEFKSQPNDRQRALAQTLAEWGVDLIIGHHPHVLQPVEWVWGEGRGRPSLVAYSLGNALFDQGAPPAARQGALLLLDLSPLRIKGMCAVPFQIDPKSWNVVPANASVEEKITSTLEIQKCGND